MPRSIDLDQWSFIASRLWQHHKRAGRRREAAKFLRLYLHFRRQRRPFTLAGVEPVAEESPPASVDHAPPHQEVMPWN